jgi:hypothetical protein
MAGPDPAIQRTATVMRFLGIDGYRKGWVAAVVDEETLSIDY